jgi:hypothetical protein
MDSDGIVAFRYALTRLREKAQKKTDETSQLVTVFGIVQNGGDPILVT